MDFRTTIVKTLLNEKIDLEESKTLSRDPSGHSTKFNPTETHKVGNYTVKHTKTIHDEPGEDDEASISITHHYDIHHNGKKVGSIKKHFNDYMGHHSEISDKHGNGFDFQNGRISAHNHLGKILGTKKEGHLK